MKGWSQKWYPYLRYSYLNINCIILTLFVNDISDLRLILRFFLKELSSLLAPWLLNFINSANGSKKRRETRSSSYKFYSFGQGKNIYKHFLKMTWGIKKMLMLGSALKKNCLCTSLCIGGVLWTRWNYRMGIRIFQKQGLEP